MTRTIHLLRRRPEEPPVCEGSGERVTVRADGGTYRQVTCRCGRQFTARAFRTSGGVRLPEPVVKMPRHAPPERTP